MVETPEAVEQPIASESKAAEQPVIVETKTVEQPAEADMPAVVAQPIVDEFKVVEQPEEIKAFEPTGASETVHNPIIEETSIKADSNVEEKPPTPKIITPAASSVEDRVTVFETQPEADNQESTQVERISSVETQSDQLTEATHFTHDTLSTSGSSSKKDSEQPVYVNHIIVHEDDEAE